jgi:hypothetical protein
MRPIDVLTVRTSGPSTRVTAEAGVGPGGSFGAGRLSILLQDPEIALWASETAFRHRVSELEALSALAQALSSADCRHRHPPNS